MDLEGNCEKCGSTSRVLERTIVNEAKRISLMLCRMCAKLSTRPPVLVTSIKEELPPDTKPPWWWPEAFSAD
ncbi:MAG: hypothetical protein HYS87_03165 [Candidatus Colwellbacteria bacterium]|nr:hypothetical protein [Candidatus Colwellbacteria bacterium]